MAYSKNAMIEKFLSYRIERPENADFRAIKELIRHHKRVPPTQTIKTSPGTEDESEVYAIRNSYSNILYTHEFLLNSALAAVRALFEFEDNVLACISHAPKDIPVHEKGIAAAIRASARVVRYKGDWVALLMLLRERGKDIGYEEMCRLVQQHAPEAPQPQRQLLLAAEWDTNRHTFPDWQCEGITYDKFRRHYLVALAASDYL